MCLIFAPDSAPQTTPGTSENRPTLDATPAARERGPAAVTGREYDRDMRIRFTAEIYEWTARRNWFFVDVPPELGADISDQPRMPRGFGSARVVATVGGTTWSTSIFPLGETYVLPLKKAVLKAEGIGEGDEIEVDLDVLDG